MNTFHNHEKLKKECLEYFRADSIWKKVFNGFREKYRSYGSFSGNVNIKNLKAEDVEALEGFFGTSFHGKKSATISAKKFSNALTQSRYREISPEEILEAFFGESLLGKAEELRILNEKISHIEFEFKEVFKDTPAACCLENFRKLIKVASHSNIREWERQLWLCAQIYNALPYRYGRKTYLAVFAADVCGNPHAFDKGTIEGELLYRIIQCDLEKRNLQVQASKIFPTYKRQKSYLMAGIMIDDVSNYALLYNVRATKTDGKKHKGIEGFSDEKSILQISLNVIANLDRMDCVNKEIYIVENPTVFAMLCSREKDKSYMCMNGQPRLAACMILDLLAKTGTSVYYSGDLDPEGLLIAQKLSQYYSGEFNFWHMDKSDYELCKSQKALSKRRMKMLENITDERLIPVAESIKTSGIPGYQENVFAKV